MWLVLVVAVLATLPFLPVLNNGFVAWDDDKNFLNNPAYRGLGLDQLRWMWTTFHLGHYVPLSWMTLGLDYEMWGMDARGYHLTSLLIHAANVGVIFVLGRRLLSKAFNADDFAITVGAAFAALWFGTHPLRVESVAWVTERRDVLSGLLYSATILVYLQAIDQPVLSRRRYATSVVLFAMALLSKATAMTLPAVLLLLNVYPYRRFSIRADRSSILRLGRELAPFMALSLAAMILSLIALDPGEQLPLAHKLAVSAYGLAFYLWKTTVPTGLAAYYPLPQEIQASAPRFLAAYATVAVAAGVALWAWRRARGVSVALVCFGLIVLPMLGIVQNGPQLAADRYTYHASPALEIMLGGLVVLGWRRRASLTAVVSTVVLLVLGALTWRQTLYWRDSYTLWTRVVEVSDDAAIAHNALGNILMEQGRPTLALDRYERAARLDPSLASAHDNLGVTLARLGRVSEAMPHFERAVLEKDEASTAYANWGMALMQLGDLDGAVDRFSKAVALDNLDPSRHSQVRFNWGVILARAGKWSDAAEQLEIAVSLDSSDTDARRALSRVRQELAKASAPTVRRAP